MNMEQILLLFISAFLSFLYSEVSSIRKSLNDLENEVLKMTHFLPKRSGERKDEDSKMS